MVILLMDAFYNDVDIIFLLPVMCQKVDLFWKAYMLDQMLFRMNNILEYRKGYVY